jgi:amidase
VDLDAANFNFPFSQGELLVLCFDFRTDLKNYFATRTGVPLAGGTLTDAIAFNNRPDIAPLELTFEDQVLWEICNDMAPGADDPQNDAFGVFGGETYNQALADGRNLAVNGIDLALAQFHLDAIIAPTGSPAWSTDLLFGDHFTLGSSNLAAPEGYPIVQVPAGTVLGLPFGISFFGSAFSEPTLIKLASGFEAVSQVRAHNLPTLAPDFPVADGTTVVAPKTKTAGEQPRQAVGEEAQHVIGSAFSK